MVNLPAIIHQRFSIEPDQTTAGLLQNEVCGSQIPLMRVGLDQRSVDAAIRHHGQPVGERGHVWNAFDGAAHLFRQMRDHVFGRCQMEDAGIFARGKNG
ncbi:hypothetical protein D3C72_1925190 [compost metagenome]